MWPQTSTRWTGRLPGGPVIDSYGGVSLHRQSHGESFLALVQNRFGGHGLYLLDEPIAGVDPAARDFILRTILTNYNEEGTVLISTHLISDVEKVLDEAIFLKEGKIMLHETVDNIREKEGRSVDALFREIFQAAPMEGGEF